MPVLLRFYSKVEPFNISDYKTKKRMEMRLRRWLSSLSKKGIVSISKVDGLIWVKANFEADGLVDLIEVTQRNSNRVTSIRLHPERQKARGILMSRHSLRVDDWRELGLCLEAYRSDVDGRVIVLKDRVTKSYLLLRYKHRFSKSYFKRLKAQYDGVWIEASKRFNRGVFITLTMNPSYYTNLYDASRDISKAFNRFMSFLSKRLGFRPAYVSVFEPMDNGNPHLHVVLFGVEYIRVVDRSELSSYVQSHMSDADFLNYLERKFKTTDLAKIGFERLYRAVNHYELTKFLRNQGFGGIHFEYRIVKRGDSWVWARRDHRPKGSKTMDVQKYLRKYLAKAFSSIYREIDWGQGIRVSEVKLGFYFASNKRFFSCSRVLMVGVGVRVWDWGHSWVFIGSWDFLDLPYELVELALNPEVVELVARGLGPPA